MLTCVILTNKKDAELLLDFLIGHGYNFNNIPKRDILTSWVEDGIDRYKEIYIGFNNEKKQLMYDWGYGFRIVKENHGRKYTLASYIINQGGAVTIFENALEFLESNRAF